MLLKNALVFTQYLTEALSSRKGMQLSDRCGCLGTRSTSVEVKQEVSIFEASAAIWMCTSTVFVCIVVV